MKYISYANSFHDLGLLKEAGHDEVILGHKDYSRFGRLSNDEYSSLATEAKRLGMRVVFEWDILMTENVLEKLKPLLPSLLSKVDALRVQDPGALEWSLNSTSLPIQFIAENGNRNLCGLKKWCTYIGNRLDRLVLSIELSKDTLAHFISELGVPCELLGFGRILLFYTPRNLLSPLTKGEELPYNEELSALGESEESPHKGFPIVENKHGTFMFHIKEFCLLEYRDILEEIGLSHFRIDLRWSDLSYLKDLDKLKEVYPHDLMRGFFLVNKTDVLFPKLKNSRLQKREGSYIGEVVEVKKSSYLAVIVKHPEGIKKDTAIKIIHPKGEEYITKIFWLKNSLNQEVEEVKRNELALIPFVNGVWVKSHLFFSK